MPDTPLLTSAPLNNYRYVAIEKEVRRGAELIARCRSQSMAQRIAILLNQALKERLARKDLSQ